MLGLSVRGGSPRRGGGPPQGYTPAEVVPGEGVLTVEFEGFLWSRLCEHSEVARVEVVELVRHAVAYYLADLDADRVAARPLGAGSFSEDSARAAPRPVGPPDA